MAKTTAELVATAYAEITFSQQPAAAEDTAAITALVTPLVQDLAARRVIVIADINAIADNIFLDLARLLAEHAAPLFGKPKDLNAFILHEARLRELARLEVGTSLALAVLERLQALELGSDAVDEAAVERVIPAVLAELTSRRVIAFANEAAVTPAARPDLVTLIAAHIQPKSATPDLIALAEARLLEISRLEVGTTLSLAVLERLQALGLGSDAIDKAAVERAIPAVLAELSSRRIISFANEAAVTAAARPDIITLIAAHVQPKSALVEPNNPNMLQAAQERLREISRFDRTIASLLTRRVLEQIEIFTLGKSVVDATMVAERLDGFLAEMASLQVAYIDDADNVPIELMPAVSLYIAASLVTPPMMAVKQDAEHTLHRLTRVRVEKAPLRTLYY